MAENEQREDKRHTTPEGRVIVANIFERNQFDERAAMRYSIEMTFDYDDVIGEGTIEDHIIDAAVAKWGPAVEDEFADGWKHGCHGSIKSPFRDGDRLAAEREKKQKPGDAYKGKLVLRAHTEFNKDGERGPGGISVFDEEMEEITSLSKGDRFYNGMKGRAAVTFEAYEMNGERGVNAYLKAFQKTDDGERLTTPQNHADMFEARGRRGREAAGEEGGGRRRRSR